jgi:two-component system phosphate regulon sensor histidine kinase PhoR
MKRNSIGFVVIIGTVSLIGILVIQFFFLKNSFDLDEKQFHELTTNALLDVARQISEYDSQVFGHPEKNIDACQVQQISNNYYVVNVNDVIDPDLLDHFLIVEFRKRNLYFKFEYAIYDCNSKKMVYGKLLTADSIHAYPQPARKVDTTRCSVEELVYDKHLKNSENDWKKKECNLPTCDKFTYYFGVHFIDRSPYYNSKLLTWYLLTGILFFVFIFFGYALYVIIRQKQLSEVQKNFINNLTHELKTPIASIELAARVLENPKIIEQPERLAEYARIVSTQNKRLSAHVERLLQMATIEKTRLQLKREEVELNSFIQEAIQEFKNSQNGLVYTVRFESGVKDAKVLADKLHFSNLIFNILDNSLKYCAKEPEIEIILEKSGKYYIVKFEDNGIGIPKSDRKRIFSRFYRVPTGNVHNVKGFGLGLDYVQKIVRRHGWSIRVVENLKKGSTFILKIHS